MAAKCIPPKVKGFPYSTLNNMVDIFHFMFPLTSGFKPQSISLPHTRSTTTAQQSGIIPDLQFYAWPVTTFFLSLFLSRQFIHILTDASRLSVLTCVSYPQWNSSELGGEQNVKQRAYSYPHAPGNPCWRPSGEPLQLLHPHQVPHPRLVLQQAAHLLVSHLFKSVNRQLMWRH